MLLILTGQRRGEVAGMRWDELSPDLRTWTLSAPRTKGDRLHVVPLAPQAAAILEDISATGRTGPLDHDVHVTLSVCAARGDDASGAIRTPATRAAAIGERLRGWLIVSGGWAFSTAASEGVALRSCRLSLAVSAIQEKLDAKRKRRN